MAGNVACKQSACCLQFLFQGMELRHKTFIEICIANKLGESGSPFQASHEYKITDRWHHHRTRWTAASEWPKITSTETLIDQLSNSEHGKKNG